MNPVWNLPFALFLATSAWCRLGSGEPLAGLLSPLLGFFGVSGVQVRRALADLFGIAGGAGLLFVAWSDRIAVAPDLWLGVDAVATSLGLGLVGAWLFARAEATSTAEDLLDEAEWDDVGKLPPEPPPA